MENAPLMVRGVSELQFANSRKLDGFKRSIQRVTLANEDVPPPFGALYPGLAEHVEQLALSFWRQLFEVGAHGVEHGLAGGDHLIAEYFTRPHQSG